METPYVPTEERSNRRFPLLLTTGRILSQYNVGAQTRRTENVQWHDADRLEIHPADAEERGITTGDTITLASRIGATTMPALVSDRVPQGVVYTTFHYPISGANVVTTEESDWATNCPEYKVTAVQVSPGHSVADLADSPLRRSGAGADDADVHPQNRVHVLAKMANQIARHLSYETPDETAKLVAAHINRFWEIDMRTDLVSASGDGSTHLDDSVRKAVALVDR